MEMRFSFKHGYPPCMKLKKNFRAKVKEWQKVPYVGPCEEFTGAKKKSKSGIMEIEKRAVAIVHEFMSLTIEKTVEVEKISHFQKWFGIDLNVRYLFLDHPGMFYLSTKGKRHTVFLREAYERGCLVYPNPVYAVRRKLLNLVVLGRCGLHSGDYKLSSSESEEEDDDNYKRWRLTEGLIILMKHPMGSGLCSYNLRIGVLALGSQLRKSAQGYFSLFKLCSCWTLFTVRMTNGFHTMSSSALLVVSFVCYLSTFFFSGVLFYLFTPSGEDRGLNTFFMVITHILVFVFAIITLHPTVSGSILPASVISLYCMYLCYSGLASEPRDYACNGLHKHYKAVSTGILCCSCWVIYNFALPSRLTSCRWRETIASIGQKRRACRERKQQTCFIFILLPHLLLPCQHVLCNASHRMVNLSRGEWQVGRCWLALSLGPYHNLVGHCRFVHMVNGCTFSLPR